MACIIWRKTISNHASLLYYQRQCLTYTAPETQIVFDEHPEAAALLSQGSEYESFVPVHPFSLPATTHTPQCWKSFEKLAWVPTVPNHKHVLFLHELRTSNDIRRLVCVVLNCEGQFDLEAIVIEPAGIISAPINTAERRMSDHGPRLTVVNERRAKRIRFYAGQVSPDDPSSFVIPFDLGLHGGTIRGRLNSNGTHVFLEIPMEPQWRAGNLITPQQLDQLFAPTSAPSLSR